MLSALLPLIAVQATMIAVKPTQGGCPSSAQITAAIEPRLPGLVVPPEQSQLREALLLTLAADPATGAQSFTLVDREQHVRLRRELPPPASADPSQCPALAETVALMVERYLQDLGYRAESAVAPDRRRWELFAGATWRPGAEGMSAYEARVGMGRMLAARRLTLSLVAGIEGTSRETWPGAQGNLHRFPAELRLLWRRGIGTTSLEMGPFAGVQLLVLRSQSREASATDLRLIPVAGLDAGLRIPLGRVPFVRVVAALGVALLRYDFVTEPRRIVAFGTERVWGKMGLEAGFSFW